MDKDGMMRVYISDELRIESDTRHLNYSDSTHKQQGGKVKNTAECNTSRNARVRYR